jgi:Flp pilus assembly protein TadD
MTVNRFIVFLILVLTVPTDAEAARKWVAYTSENFTIYSDQKEKRVLEVLNEFEKFRKAVIHLTNLNERPENSRMQIIMYSRSSDYRKIAPSGSLGFYFNSSAGPRLLIGAESAGIDDRMVLFHEYVHYVVREQTRANFPRWYDEGFAEFLAATAIEEDSVIVGLVPKGRGHTLASERRMRIEDLLEPKDGSASPTYWSRFYAYSWLFTHYLQIYSVTSDTPLIEQTNEFMRRYNSGEDSVRAFKISFGITPAQMDEQLIEYRRSNKLSGIQILIDDYAGDIKVTELDGNQRIFLLADIAWRTQEEKLARKYLKKIKTHEPNAAVPLSLAAILHNHQGDWETAEKLAIQAYDFAPDDTQVLTNLAHLELDRYEDLLDDLTSTEATLQTAIEFGVRAIEVDPTNYEAYYYLWRIYSDAEQFDRARDSLMTALQLRPSDPGHILAIGLFEVSRGEFEVATPYLEQALAWTHSDIGRQKIQELLDSLTDPSIDPRVVLENLDSEDKREK